jgi:DNA-binding GntR family transcriptional regulator
MAGQSDLNPFGHDPLYVQLANVLRQRIVSGELKHLDPLPSEDRLKDEFGISRDTVRRAMNLLRNEGLVFTVPQRGTFVGPRPALERHDSRVYQGLHNLIGHVLS